MLCHVILYHAILHYLIVHCILLGFGRWQSGFLLAFQRQPCALAERWLLLISGIEEGGPNQRLILGLEYSL